MPSSLFDTLKFKVPQTSNLLENVGREPPRYHWESSSHSLRPPAARNPHFVASSANSIYGGSSTSRNDRRFFGNATRSEMPPPQTARLGRRPYQHPYADESTLPNNSAFNRMLHSTPLNSISAVRKQSLFRPQTESSLAVSNWSGMASTYRGTESVRSFCSNNNDFIEKLLQRGLNKFLSKGRFNPEYEDLAIQVANGLKFCVQEAALELAPDEGSVRSHFSKHAATWKSGMSTLSDRSLNTFQSLQKLRQGTSMVRRDTSPAKSIECSMERVAKTRRPYERITEKPALDSQFMTNFKVMEKSIQPSKRCLTPEQNDKECSEPQTVRRRLNSDDGHVSSSTAVQGFESPTSTIDNEVVRTSCSSSNMKGGKPTLLDALAGRTGILTHDDDDDFLPTTSEKKRKSSEKKTKTKNQPQNKKKTCAKKSSTSPSVSISAVAIVAIASTRSGRNVKKPSFYQMPEKMKSNKKASAASNESEKDQGDIDKVKKVPECNEPGQKEPKKPSIRKAVKPVTPAVVEEPVPTVFTKRGRAIKPTALYGAVKMLTPSPAVVRPNPLKPKPADQPSSPKKQAKTVKKPKAKKGNSPQKRTEVTPKSKPEIDIDDDLSMSGLDFYIPEVTQSTRRGAKRKNATEKALTAQTPPLTHFTANLHSDIVASASNTGRSTPDWQPSQRTESEARELQKRKLGPRKKKQAKEPVRRGRPPKKSPINLNLVKMARKSIAAKLQSMESNSCDSSNESETE